MSMTVLVKVSYLVAATLFYADNTRMLYGDGAEAASALVSELKALDGGH